MLWQVNTIQPQHLISGNSLFAQVGFGQAEKIYQN